MKTAKSANLHTPPSAPARKRRRTSKRARRRAGDWAETVARRDHLPLQQRMSESIDLSSMLSKLPVIGREEEKDVVRMVPDEIIPILKAANIEFVLAGAHGVGGWLAETRATQDVDFIIRLQDARKAVEAVNSKMPQLEVEKHPDVIRFKNAEQYVLDFILTRNPLFRRVFKEYCEIFLHGRKIRIPKLECALAMKFAAMTGHYRNLRKKYMDISDFISLVEANKKIDLSLLAELGELHYEGGGKEVVQYVADARAGRKLEI